MITSVLKAKFGNSEEAGKFMLSFSYFKKILAGIFSFNTIDNNRIFGVEIWEECVLKRKKAYQMSYLLFF